MIDSGKLRHRISIEQLQELLDSNGDVIQDQTTGEISKAWVEVAKVWASIEPISGREFIQSDAKQSGITERITIRARNGIDASMRLVHLFSGTVYNVHGILRDRESGLEYITMPVSSNVSIDGQ